MVEHEAHQHHGHGTGNRWLDIALALSAFIVSLVSLYLGIHSAKSMDKLVAANSYPYLMVQRSNMKLDADGSWGGKTIDLDLTNNGVGPARIEWLTLDFNGKSMRNYGELLAACCTAAGPLNGMNIRGTMDGYLIPVGQATGVLHWAAPKEPNARFEQLREALYKMKLTVCYCSVFEECYQAGSDLPRPERVEACEAPATAFQPRLN